MNGLGGNLTWWINRLSKNMLAYEWSKLLPLDPKVESHAIEMLFYSNPQLFVLMEYEKENKAAISNQQCWWWWKVFINRSIKAISTMREDWCYRTHVFLCTSRRIGKRKKMRLQTSLLVAEVLSILMIILFPKKEDEEMKRSKFYQKERNNTKI